MATTEIQSKGQTVCTFKNQAIFPKNKAVTFGIQSSKSIPEQRPSINQKIVESALPINFFHSPGEYNKILIQRGCKQKISNVDRQIGILRSLQYLNDPLFQKEKQKSYQRIRQYKQKLKQQQSLRTNSNFSKCICCCCDDFCPDCARTCQKQESIQDKTPQPESVKSSNWLIDIQAMKKGEYQRKIKKSVVHTDQQIKSCNSRPFQSKYRIQSLINDTLIKTIQNKRCKELTKLIQDQHKKAIANFNDSVRMKNQSKSASKSKNKSSLQPTKAEIRQAYWQSIKDVIAYELKKQNSKNKVPQQVKNTQCHRSKSKPHLSPQKINKLRVQRGKQALSELKKHSEQKCQLSKIKMKKLLVLDAKQTQILKKCRVHKFKPSEQMIQSAFTNLA